eukprot:762883-Hanusia_phi.AAC.1
MLLLCRAAGPRSPGTGKPLLPFVLLVLVLVLLVLVLVPSISSRLHFMSSSFSSSVFPAPLPSPTLPSLAIHPPRHPFLRPPSSPSSLLFILLAPIPTFLQLDSIRKKLNAPFLEVGQWCSTWHTNLVAAHVAFHLVVESSPHPVNPDSKACAGLKSVVRAAARQFVTGLAVPILLTETSAEGASSYADGLCGSAEMEGKSPLSGGGPEGTGGEGMGGGQEEHSTAQHSTAEDRTGQDRTGQDRTGQEGGSE